MDGRAVVVVIIVLVVVWFVFWRCTVTVTLTATPHTLSPTAGGTITLTATYVNNRGHGFTSANPVSAVVTYISPSGTGALSPGAQPSFTHTVTANPAGGHDVSVSVTTPYPAGGRFEVAVTANDDNGDSGTTVARFR